MLSLRDRLNLLEQDLDATPPGFVVNTDLPFALFRYDPKHPEESEWHMRREIQKLRTRCQIATGKRVTLLSLAKLFWKGVKESEGLDALVDLERQRGFEVAQAQVTTYLSDPDWRPLTELIAEATSGMDPQREYLFLTRAAVFAPAAYRTSSLLEQLMGKVRVPVVLFYPGSWTGSLNFLGLRSDMDAFGSYRVKIYGRD